MDTNNRPDHIEDYLANLHTGQWFGWSNSKNKVYANLVIHSNLPGTGLILFMTLKILFTPTPQFKAAKTAISKFFI